MRTQIARARAHYERGLNGVWRLPADSQLAIVLAGQLYSAILDAIEAADYDVFSRRAATSTWFKLGQAIRWSVALRRPRWSRIDLPAARAARQALPAADDRLAARS